MCRGSKFELLAIPLGVDSCGTSTPGFPPNCKPYITSTLAESFDQLEACVPCLNPGLLYQRTQTFHKTLDTCGRPKNKRLGNIENLRRLRDSRNDFQQIHRAHHILAHVERSLVSALMRSTSCASSFEIQSLQRVLLSVST